MRTHGNTRAGRALLFLDMHLKVVGPVAFRCLERVRRMHPKAAQRAIGDISCKFIQHIQVTTGAQVTDYAFEYAGDAFHTNTTWHAFSTGLVAKITTALHRPCYHAGASGQQFDDTRTHNRASFFEWIIIERSEERR